jgi:uncharacterized protein YbjT (DUF2867 family)
VASAALSFCWRSCGLELRYTLFELAAQISRQTGRTIRYRNLPEAEYAAALAGFELPEALAQAIAGWDVGASKGRSSTMVGSFPR